MLHLILSWHPPKIIEIYSAIVSKPRCLVTFCGEEYCYIFNRLFPILSILECPYLLYIYIEIYCWLLILLLQYISTILSIPPLIPARIQEFQRILAGIDRNPTGLQRILLFRLYFVLLFQTYVLEQGNWPK